MRKILYLFAIILGGLFILTSCNEEQPDIPPVNDPNPPVVEDNTVTLYFETFGGEKIDPITGLEPGTEVKLPTPTREGYIFDYWYTTETLEFNTDLRKTVKVKETMTVYAGWFALNYTISFITDCGIRVQQLDALTDEPITLPVIERESYEFLGWYEGDTLYTRTTMEPRNFTLTAKWQRIAHNVVLDTAGGSLEDKYLNQKVEHNKTLSLPTPTKDGYVFLGWYNNEELITEQTVITDDLTIVAKYDSIDNYSSSYQINYVLNGGSLENSVTKYQTGSTLELPVPSYDDYLFLGWYSNPEFTGNVCEKISSSDYGNKTFYAKWANPNAEYVVTFLSQDGEIVETQKVKYGEKANKVTFDGEAYIDYEWFLGNHIFDFNQVITSDITLRANWRILDTILEDLIPNIALGQLDLMKLINTSIGNISIYWSSSDSSTINTRGIVNPLREDTIITLTATFSLNKQSYVHTIDVLVPAVQLRDLTSTTPVFAYMASNMTSYEGLSGIHEQTIDVINYCFVRVTKDGNLSNGELLKIQEVVTARQQGIRVLFSIGAYGTGETGCHNFSIYASTSEGREKLIGEIIKMIQKYHLDGIDIDWEYPGVYPAPGISSEEDKVNYTIFMQELRQALDELGPGYLLTAAIPGSMPGRYELDKLKDVLDYIHLMTYDLHSGSRTSHHTALYSSNNTPYGSVDSSVKAFINHGFPKEKLVIGCAFYGRMWTLSSTVATPMGATNIVSGTAGKSVTYTQISTNYLKREGIISKWDDVSQAPYIYDRNTNEFISYDNPHSIGLKCEYVLDNELGGVMFWDYGEDGTGKLVDKMYEVLKASK